MKKGIRKKIALNVFILISLLFFCVQHTYTQIKGVWVTNVASDALMSREKIKECVAICNASGFTDIFMVVYNNAYTLYPSKIMDSLFAVKINPVYGQRDPLQEMIEEAHLQKIRVHAWFEFGFSCSYDANGGKIVKKFPHWAALNADGKLVTKNKFDWLNAFDPEVQQFMKSLILEVVKNYAIDGIQGDDRLPANPSTAGYDAYTVQLYKNSHHSQEPPKNYKDSSWVQWRSDLLTGFLVQLYKAVKKLKPHVQVTMAPSVFPWSKEEYLQDWPRWLQLGVVDYIFPQVYRYNFTAYRLALTDLNRQLSPEQKNSCFPGVLQSLGNGYRVPDTLLTQFIAENRKQGFAGEVFFYFEGVKKNQSWFEKEYSFISLSGTQYQQTIDEATKQRIRKQVKFYKTVTIRFNGNVVILKGSCTAAQRMQLMELITISKVKYDVRRLQQKQ